MTYEISKIIFWSDSQTTLQYIKNEAKRFQTYVANRCNPMGFVCPVILEAKKILQKLWKHLPWKG